MKRRIRYLYSFLYQTIVELHSRYPYNLICISEMDRTMQKLTTTFMLLYRLVINTHNYPKFCWLKKRKTNSVSYLCMYMSQYHFCFTQSPIIRGCYLKLSRTFLVNFPLSCEEVAFDVHFV